MVEGTANNTTWHGSQAVRFDRMKDSVKASSLRDEMDATTWWEARGWVPANRSDGVVRASLRGVAVGGGQRAVGRGSSKLFCEGG